MILVKILRKIDKIINFLTIKKMVEDQKNIFEKQLNNLNQSFFVVINRYNSQERELNELHQRYDDLQQRYNDLEQRYEALHLNQIESLSNSIFEFLTPKLNSGSIIEAPISKVSIPRVSIPRVSTPKIPTPKISTPKFDVVKMPTMPNIVSRLVIPEVTPEVTPEIIPEIVQEVIPKATSSIVLPQVTKARGRPKGSTSKKDLKNITLLVCDDFTKGEKQIDNEWFEGKEDFFIAQKVADCYNNICDKGNGVINLDNALHNFVMGYNYLKDHTNYGFIYDKKRHQIIAYPLNKPITYYTIDLDKIGVIFDKDQGYYVLRKYGS